MTKPKAVILLIAVGIVATGLWAVMKPFDSARRLSPASESWLYQSRLSLFETLDSEGAEAVFAGASIIQYGEWSELFGCPVLNRGIAGDTTASFLKRCGQLAAMRPRNLFVMVGLNDLMRRRSGDEIDSNMCGILSVLRQDSSETVIRILSILPVRASSWAPKDINEAIVRTNDRLRLLCEARGVKFIDLHQAFLDGTGRMDASCTTDGVHLNGRGYKRIQRLLAPCLSAAMKP